MNGFDLRPLSLGEILDRTFSLYRRHFLLFLGISAIPHLLTLALNLPQIVFLPSSAGIEMDGRAQTQLHPWGGSPRQVIVTILTIGLSIFVYLLSQAGTVFAVSELYLGRTTSREPRESPSRSWDLTRGYTAAPSFCLCCTRCLR